MNSTVNMLLRAAITAAATDREKFIEQVSSIIEERIGTSAEKSDTVAREIGTFIESFDRQLAIDQLLDSKGSFAGGLGASVGGSPQGVPMAASPYEMHELGYKIDRLTEAIDRLRWTLESPAPAK